MTENIGNSPATHVKIWAAATPFGHNVPHPVDPLVRAKEIADRMRNTDFGYSIFPNQPISSGPVNYMVQIPNAMIAEATTDDPMILFGLAVIADYKFAGGEGRTSAMYTVWGRDPETGELRHLDSRLPQITPDQVRLQRSPMADNAA